MSKSKGQLSHETSFPGAGIDESFDMVKEKDSSGNPLLTLKYGHAHNSISRNKVFVYRVSGKKKAVFIVF